jgi:hypothetical protein
MGHCPWGELSLGQIDCGASFHEENWRGMRFHGQVTMRKLSRNWSVLSSRQGDSFRFHEQMTKQLLKIALRDSLTRFSSPAVFIKHLPLGH